MLSGYVKSLFLTICLLSPHLWARDDSTMNVVRTVILDHFDPYSNLPESQGQEILNELLDTRSQSRLAFPAFPRTWVELGSSRPFETTTNRFFDTSKLAQAISVFAGPFSFPAQVVLNGAQLGYRREVSIKYAYNQETTFMAMTSLRPINPQATQNQTTPVSATSSDLRSIIDQKADMRNYFKVTPEFPMVGLCKYEMSLIIEETDEGTLSFIFGSSSEARKIVARSSYTVFSNFFQIESHVPVQEYLRTRCGENFSEAVRFIVEEDFNKLVSETFTHYHPQAQCRWSPSTNKSPAGDSDCMNWFEDQNFMGLRKNETIPRCVIGEQGFPVCAIRSKAGAYCPTYASRGVVHTHPPERYDRQLNPMENVGFVNYHALFPCDVGLSCKFENGTPLTQLRLPVNERERIRELSRANYITTCQRPGRHGK